MKAAARSAVTLALWLAALRTFAAGLALSIQGTTVDGYFPVVLLGLALGWLAERTDRKLRAGFRRARAPMVVAFLLVGAGLAFIHNGGFVPPLAKFTSASMRYQWQRIEERSTHIVPDPTELHNAQADLANQWADINLHLETLLENLRAGNAETDAIALQVAWSLPAFILFFWAGWQLRQRQRALPALFPATALLAYFQYYSQPDSLNFLLHLLTLLMLAALAEGSEPLRNAPTRGLTSDTLTATFLVCIFIIIIAGMTPSISARAIAKAAARELQEQARQEQNDATAKALGLKSGPGESAPAQYEQPGLPQERLLQGAPELSRTLIFTVATGDLPPMERLPRDERPPRYYWRTITYDAYTGHGWAVTINESRDEDANDLMIDIIPVGYRLLDLDLSFFSPSRLVWTGQLARASQPLHAAWRSLPNSRSRSLDPLRGADLIAATSNANELHVQSIMPMFTMERLRASSTDYPDWVKDQYLALPPDLPVRVRQLANEIVSGRTNPYDRAGAIETYLRRFPYTLNVPLPPTDRDVADYFLFDLQTGYCDYYATAMVVLARAAGLPARLVSGYASGEYIPAEAIYRVRESDGHSWVEVYFTGLGWVEFEPTANRPQIERAVEEFNAEREIPVLEASPTEPASRLTALLNSLAAVSWSGWLMGIFLIGLLLLAFVAARERLQQNTPVQTITNIYQNLYRLGRPLLGPTNRVHTPLTFARALASRLEISPRSNALRNLLIAAPAELSALTDLYIRAIYSPVPPTREETREAIKIGRMLVLRLWVIRISKSKLPKQGDEARYQEIL